MIIALKTIREAKGVSVDELAEKTGLTKMKIWNYESGRNQPDPEALCLLADALDVSLDMLVRGKEKDRSEERSLESSVNLLKRLSPEEQDVLVAIASLLQYRKQSSERRDQEQKETP